MATPEEQAVALKNQGNKAFAAHDWPTAIDFYSQAIELNDKEPTFWSNRAQVGSFQEPDVTTFFVLLTYASWYVK